jgi:uncharacterized protein (DUF1330 family)
MPAAYVIADTRVKDKTVLERYRKLAHVSVQKFGGQYLTAGGTVEVLTGEWEPERCSIVRFENMQTARDWWNCAEYREARALRDELGSARIFIVEGV